MTQFTQGELEVMRVLWQHGELKPAEIQEHFQRPIKNPALRSYLTILLDKGHVTRRKAGKAYYYKARSRKDRALRGMVSELANTFFGGSSEALMANLIRTEDLSDEELIRLKRIADGEDGTSEQRA